MCKNLVVYREMFAGEEEEVCELVLRVFDRFVAPQFSQQGIGEFREYVKPDALEHRIREGQSVIIAIEDDAIVGMVEVREGMHISLLFVSETNQGRGIGRALVTKVLNCWNEVQDPQKTVTVHASANSVGFYRKVGFMPEGSERIENGIRFTPMRMDRSELG